MVDFFREFLFYTRVWVFKNPIKTFLFLYLGWRFYYVLPKQLFNESYSFVMESNTGELLGARIAADGQWRFPPMDSVPEKFKACIIRFEDRYFNYHPGINPVSIYNAFQDNRKAGRVVRGGSTLSQQVIRLSRKNPERTYAEKLKEAILALRLELTYSKDEILSLYASHAPFGGNVVGLDMAAYRYFGVYPHQLTWAQAATLAVLPNAPGLIYPGANQNLLLKKRNALLKALKNDGLLSNLEYDLALHENLPTTPHKLPQLASHALNFLNKKSPVSRVKSTIDFNLQERIQRIVESRYATYAQNEVHNMAILVVDVETRQVLAYVGNTPTTKEHQSDVDNVHAKRSSGSIWKPFLYAEMLDEGTLLKSCLIADVPTQIAGFTPENSNLSYEGAVPAWKALSMSLNIPAVLLLQEFGVNKFYAKLKEYGMSTLTQPPGHYGLSLILGGAETSLWDLCRVYAGYVGIHNMFHEDGAYRSQPFANLILNAEESLDLGKSEKQPVYISASAIHQTFEAMREVNRPEHNDSWQYFSSSEAIAWKTGTSFGNRDAWAIGCSKKYVVGVWVGNSSGEGRPELTGAQYAGSVLFDVFPILEKSSWFKRPETEMEIAEICKTSGFLAGPHCPMTTDWVCQRGLESKVCQFHEVIHTDLTEQYRVNRSCASDAELKEKVWFSLPPLMEWYYKKKHASYKKRPPWREDCLQKSEAVMAFIYPRKDAEVYRAKDFNGDLQPILCKVAHTNPEAQLYWYLNSRYVGTTERHHEFPLDAPVGEHVITVVDDQANEVKCRLVVK